MDAATGAAPSGNRYLAGFMTLGLLAGIANGTAKILLPLYAASLHASRAQIGFVGGLQFLGLLLLSLPIGSMLGRVGSRRMFRIGAVGGAIVYAVLFPLAESPWQLIACVALFGMFNPMRMVTTQTEFLRLVHTVDPRRAGWNRAAHSAGMFFLGPMLGAAVLTWLGFVAAFQLSAVALLVCVLIGDRILASLPAQPFTPSRTFREHVRGFVRMLSEERELRKNLAIELAGQMAMTYFSVFVVLIATQKLNLGAQAAAGLVTLEGACFVLTLFSLGALVQRLAEQHRYRLSFATIALSQACFMSASAAWMLTAGAVLLGVGLGFLHLTLIGRFAALARDLGRGQVGGLFTMTGPLGGILGASAGGLAAQHFGLLAGFHVLFALFASLLLLACLRPWRRAGTAATSITDIS